MSRDLPRRQLSRSSPHVALTLVLAGAARAARTAGAARRERGGRIAESSRRRAIIIVKIEIAVRGQSRTRGRTNHSITTGHTCTDTTRMQIEDDLCNLRSALSNAKRPGTTTRNRAGSCAEHDNPPSRAPPTHLLRTSHLATWYKCLSIRRWEVTVTDRSALSF